MCKEKEFPMNFVPVKSIHLSTTINHILTISQQNIQILE